jgi:hypothetical protein
MKFLVIYLLSGPNYLLSDVSRFLPTRQDLGSRLPLHLQHLTLEALAYVQKLIQAVSRPQAA